ncbi:hypothetical protein L0Y34_01200 [Candidatus Parcubacteria bacterium]|nr:hypothetical protein [Candidatus Parcubacteria bacterium]
MAEEKKSGGSGSAFGDVFFFLGILLLFFLLWVAGGGPNRPISFAGPFLRPISSVGTTAQPYGDPSQGFGSFGTGISIGGWGATVGVTTSGAARTSSQQGAVTFLPDTYGAKNRDAEDEYLTITASSLASGEISMAGWTLMSKETGQGAPLPQGTEVAEAGRVNQLRPITLKPGDTAIVATGRSPVGISFRENTCTGYFEERQDFSPALALGCPTPYQEYLRFRGAEDDECAAFVRSIPYCSAPTSVPDDIHGSCEEFVDDYLNYNGCVSAHRNDSNFEGRTWRIFLGERDELWRASRETILLLDAEGNVVDSLSY